MAFHELGSNAVRYGALSGSEGHVSLAWSIERSPSRGDPAEAASQGFAVIEWREQEGPGLAGPPDWRGFGSRLLERGVAQQFGGRIGLEFLAEGLVCRMRLPLRPETIADPE